MTHRSAARSSLHFRRVPRTAASAASRLLWQYPVVTLDTSDRASSIELTMDSARDVPILHLSRDNWLFSFTSSSSYKLDIGLYVERPNRPARADRVAQSCFNSGLFEAATHSDAAGGAFRVPRTTHELVWSEKTAPQKTVPGGHGAA